METERKSLWKQVIVFLTLTFVFTGIVFLLAFLNGGSLSAFNGLASLLLMWCPGAAALITIRIFKQSFKDLGWKFGKAKYLGLDDW